MQSAIFSTLSSVLTRIRNDGFSARNEAWR
jgi:hypothetical protein